MFILLTLIAFLLAQLWEIKTRQKESESSPEEWNPKFFWKDNKYKLPVSLGISLSLSLLFYLAVVLEGEPWYSFEITEGYTLSFNLKYLLYISFGLVPELVIQFLKDRFNFLQPKEVTVLEDGEETTYQRR